MPLGKRRKRRWPAYLGGLAGAFGLVVILVGYYGIGPYDMPGQSRKLDAVMEESKRLGLPMTQADLKPDPPVPDDQNAAPDVIRFAEQVRLAVRVTGPAPALDDDAAMEEAVTKAGPYIDAIVETLETKPEWFIDRDYDDGPNILLPEFADIKAAAKHLVARAVARAEGRDLDGALRDIRAARDLRHRLMDEPFLIAMLVAVSIDAIALRGCEDVMTEFDDDPEALGRIEAMLTDTVHRIDPRPALRGEFYLALSITRNLTSYGGYQAVEGMSGDSSLPQVDPDKLVRTGLPEGMWPRAFLASTASEWNRVFQSFEGADVPLRGWGAAIDVCVDEKAENFRLSDIITRLLFPVFGQADSALSKNDANNDIHLALVRVLKFRAENGRLPESLEEADAAFPDPFSDGTVRATLTEEEVRIWTVGPNGVDDGGLSRTRTDPDRDDLAAFWPATKRAEHSEK